MSKKATYLPNRCKYDQCNALLQASRAEDPAKREKLDSEKEYCGPICRGLHAEQKMHQSPVVMKFLYGG